MTNHACDSAPIQRGFTLVEAMIALVIFAAGIIALSKFQSTVTLSGGLAKARTEALAAAQEKIEDLKHYKSLIEYDAIASTVTPHETVVGKNATFTRQVTVTEYIDPGYKLVQVDVTWTDRLGNQSVTLKTNISESDPEASAELMMAIATGTLGGDGGEEEEEVVEEEEEEVTATCQCHRQNAGSIYLDEVAHDCCTDAVCTSAGGSYGNNTDFSTTCTM